MGKNNPQLSIIIVNFHSERFLDACLRSIREKIIPKVETEIIVVNNDRSEFLEKIRTNFPEVSIRENDNNGFGHGCNKGVQIARGRFLFFLNPDTEILSENIKEALDFLAADKENAILGSCLITPQKEIQPWSAGAAVNLYDLARNNFGLSRSRKIWKSSKTTRAFWVAGTAMFVKKDIFQKIGGFDEKITMYFEDVDICRRASRMGFGVFYFPHFQILHKSGESYDDKGEQKMNYYVSQQYYFEKHCGRFQSTLVKILRRILVKETH